MDSSQKIVVDNTGIKIKVSVPQPDVVLMFSEEIIRNNIAHTQELLYLWTERLTTLLNSPEYKQVNPN